MMLNVISDEQKCVHRSIKTNVQCALEEMYNKCCKVPAGQGCLQDMHDIVRAEMKRRKKHIFGEIEKNLAEQLGNLVVRKHVPVSNCE